ncbi:uncharacterized protein HD556DRAFT_1463372 [Suillus plorans]|uniref:ABC transporter domain-containing protein n=1 Tax=Suillus plorans TaxID=116603 RepID=A0A9P7A8U1_9AGAM|nr:uncharacterized protein HD556DRAFT_1463372 [Suillus plorans]KAG1784554.1 hypothetical protein HD556DRAFT_1463372 [Suillus plorans]
MTSRSTRSQVNHRESSRRGSSPKPPMPASAKGIDTPSSSSTSSDDEFRHKEISCVCRYITSRGEESIKGRELSVMFKDLRIVGVGARASLQLTIGSMLNPAAILRNTSAMRNQPVRIFSQDSRVSLRLVKCSVSRFNELTSSRTTWFRLQHVPIANQCGEYHAIQSEVCYDFFTPKDIARQYRGDVIYCPDDDVHFPTLTVEQTLSFAIKMRTPHARFIDQTREQFNRDVVDILVRIFGLRHARNTVVGDAAIRGVSGGEKKRVSIAEALSCRALIGAWDK